MKRRLVSILVCAAVVTGLLTGATTVHAEEKRTIAVVTYSLAEEFGVDVIKGAEAKAEELGNIEIVYPDAAGDMQKSIAIVEDMTTQGVDAICISPVDASATIPYIEKAREAGIAVVNWDIEMDTVVLCQDLVQVKMRFSSS